MPSKIVGYSVSVQLVDDLNLLIEVLDVLGALIFRDFYMRIPFHDELTPMLQFIKFLI